MEQTRETAEAAEALGRQAINVARAELIRQGYAAPLGKVHTVYYAHDAQGQWHRYAPAEGVAGPVCGWLPMPRGVNPGDAPSRAEYEAAGGGQPIVGAVPLAGAPPMTSDEYAGLRATAQRADARASIQDRIRKAAESAIANDDLPREIRVGRLMRAVEGIVFGLEGRG